MYLLSNEKKRFFQTWLSGCFITLISLGMGISLVWFKQVTHDPNWIGNIYKEKDIVQIRLLEPLSEKEKSFKALAEFVSVYKKDKAIPVSGKLMLYFKKDSLPPAVTYGSIIAISKAIPAIKNANNPGGFDYKRYALFNEITNQLFLKEGEYVVTKQRKISFFYNWLFHTKTYILETLRMHIKGAQEISVAEALLIGYRDDLDRDLVQAYSNTGVVHVIAISGLHLGLIYWLLLFLLKPLDKNKQFLWLKPIIAISLLWIFSLLTGASASVVRAAIMFTAIGIGGLLGKKGTIYNSMAASAFVMLCYNPFLLWDVGFQLSYAAVLSIVIFMKPIYHWVSFQNKLLDKAWQLNAVTLSAQILTLPLCMYHFHQAPNLFLITNFVAVPLSSFILFGEILLIAVSFAPTVAAFVGYLLSYFLQWMNHFITWVDAFSFAVTDGIQHSPLQTILLFAFIGAAGIWLVLKKRNALKWSLSFLLLFFLVQSFYKYKSFTQNKLVVYNLSQHSAIDFMVGNQYYFTGDADLLQDGFLKNFHLKPSRIFFRTYHHPHTTNNQNAFCVNGKKLVVINQSYRFLLTENKIKVDVLIISKNPKLYIENLLKTFDCKLIVFDSSNPQWKVNLWIKDCQRLHLNYFHTGENGAFVMNL